MHEEAASIPQASGWFRDTTEHTAQQPTCKSTSLPHPRLFWASLPLWWLSLSNHTNKAWARKTWETGGRGEEGEEMHCLLFILFFFKISTCQHMVRELIYGTAASLKQSHLAGVYNKLARASPKGLKDKSALCNWSLIFSVMMLFSVSEKVSTGGQS